MSWSGANISAATRHQEEEEENHNYELKDEPSSSSLTTKRRRRRRRESSDATVTRLTSTFHTSMQCIAAMVKADRYYLGRDNNNNTGGGGDDDEVVVVENVAQSAKDLLENMLLHDPFISGLAPLLVAKMRNDRHRKKKNLLLVENDVHYKQLIADKNDWSNRNISKIRSLCYAILLNYADLLCTALISSSSRSSHRYTKELSFIKPLKSGITLFQSESESLLLDRSLLALCEASDIDGSDPLLWLKIYKLASVYCEHKKSDDYKEDAGGFSSNSLRKLARTALHAGSNCLPKGVPKNRMLEKCRAKEITITDTFSCSPMCDVEGTKQHVITTKLEKNTWIVLVKHVLENHSSSTFIDEGASTLLISFKVPRLELVLKYDHALSSRISAYLSDVDKEVFGKIFKSKEGNLCFSDDSKEKKDVSNEDKASKKILSRQDSSTADRPKSSRSSRRVQNQSEMNTINAQRDKNKKSLEYCVTKLIKGFRKNETFSLRKLEDEKIEWDSLCYLQSYFTSKEGKFFGLWEQMVEDGKKKGCQVERSDRVLLSVHLINMTLDLPSSCTTFMALRLLMLKLSLCLERYNLDMTDNRNVVYLKESFHILRTSAGLPTEIGLPINQDLKTSLDKVIDDLCLNLLFIEYTWYDIFGDNDEGLCLESIELDYLISRFLSHLDLTRIQFNQDVSASKRSAHHMVLTVLEMRAFWVISRYYLQLSKQTFLRNHEDQAQFWLKRALHAFKKSEKYGVSYFKCLGNVEKVTLERIQRLTDEIDAIALVSRCKEEFLKLLQSEKVALIESKSRLIEINVLLMQRYQNKDGVSKEFVSFDKIEEIVVDFIDLHGKILRTKAKYIDRSISSTESIAMSWGEGIWGLFSFDSIDGFKWSISQHASILQIILFCFLSEGKKNSMLTLISEIIYFFCSKEPHFVDDEELSESYWSLLNFFVDKVTIEVEMTGENENQDFLCRIVVRIMRAILFLTSSKKLITSASKPVVNESLITAMLLLFRVARKFDRIENIGLSLLAEYVSRERVYFPLFISRFEKSVPRKYLTECCKLQANCISTLLLQFCKSATDIFVNGKASWILELIGSTQASDFVLFHFISSLVWFFDMVVNAEISVENGSCSPTERLYETMSKTLKVPLATSLTLLCGEVGCSPSNEYSRTLSEIFDPVSSDEDDVEERGMKLNPYVSTLTRLCIHIVSSINEYVDDSTAASQGAIFLLSIVRVLSRISDHLLKNASEEGVFYLADYPRGARTCGKELDRTLSRAFNRLYGLHLSVQGTSSSTSELSKLQYSAPESSKQACQLFRCICRLYREEDKRTVPFKALQCVSRALPPVKKNNNIFDLIFNLSSPNYFTVIDSLPQNISSLLENNSESGDSEEIKITNEIKVVQKGLSHKLADGPIPTPPENHSLENDRDVLSQYERALCTKFRSIIDDLSYSPRSCEGWCKAADCLATKANLISDRISYLSEYDSKSKVVDSDFFAGKESLSEVDKSLPRKNDKESILEYLMSQEELNNWVPTLGSDLSVYVDFSWSDFNSLVECSKKIGGGLESQQTKEKEIFFKLQCLFQEGKFSEWQRAWGSIFVSTLRASAKRCLIIARKLASETSLYLANEISERIGIMLYSEIQGSTLYGYPTQLMPKRIKYSILKECLKNFQSVCSSNVQRCQEEQLTFQYEDYWEHLFMIGKCQEKIANLFIDESFVHNRTREYEVSMSKALDSYSRSFEEASKLDLEVVEGGSGHGVTEVFYRLHASRFKVLLRSIQVSDTVNRTSAEREAVAIVAKYLYAPAEAQMSTSSEEELRSTVWSLFSDCVTCFAKCRHDNQFFHRSVYRHAQALNWTPLFYNPELYPTERDKLDVIPSHKAVDIRGYNSTGSLASSLNIMRVLFDKKRSQLCALWLTSTSVPTLFEQINGSTRKYDALRQKYTSAFVNLLKKCSEKSSKLDPMLSSFAGWMKSANRDLPGLYYVSASRKGDTTDLQLHMKDSLVAKGTGYLYFTKLLVNEAVASFVTKKLDDSALTELEMNELYEIAHNNFLRLNCDIDDIAEGSLILSVKALTKAYLSTRKNLGSMSEVEILRKIFPKRVSKLSKKRKSITPERPVNKQPEAEKNPESEENPEPAIKQATSKKVFTVNVPPGLKAGDFFIVMAGEGSNKRKFRLQVPPGEPKRLKFSS